MDIHSSTNFTVPRGVKKIDCFCVGGGASGNAIAGDGDVAGCGAGYTRTESGVKVNSREVIPIVIGAGGAGCENGATKGSTTQVSSINFIINAGGGQISNAYVGGNGGSGGGCCARPGGKDGDNGEAGSFSYDIPGTGQQTTTRYFGESNGTLYSTGGCGTNSGIYWVGGETNTGNAGSSRTFSFPWLYSNPGGSGVCIIRWDDQKS